MMPERDHFRASVFNLGQTEVDLELVQMINSNLERFQELKDKTVPGFQVLSFSIRTVKKFVMVAGRTGSGKVSPDLVIEIVDYDPVRDSAIVVGSSGQPADVSLHWFIYRAMPEVNSIARLDVSLSEKQFTEAGIYCFEKKMEVLRPDAIMNLLPVIKDNKKLFLPGQGLIIHECSFADLVGCILAFLEDSGKLIEKGAVKTGEEEA